MPTKLVDELVELNRAQSERFTDPGQSAARRRYRAEHPTEIVCLKCMDGRVNMPLLTGAPMGVMHPFRNIGGIFDLGWPALSLRLTEIVDRSIKEAKSNLFMATYHFAKGDSHRGCRGHGYDKEKAFKSARSLVKQIETVFGARHEQVYPILVGIETDEESLIFHDRTGDRSAVMAEYINKDESAFRDLTRDFYPDMPPMVANDLLPLMQGNAAHVAGIRGTKRPQIELEHRERIVAIGQGFDWLHRANYALIVNDLDPQMDDAIGKAVGIIKDNRDKKRIPASGALLFASVCYTRQGHHRTAAIARAKYLTRLGLESIRKFHPDTADFFQPLTAVVNWDTRSLEIVSK